MKSARVNNARPYVDVVSEPKMPPFGVAEALNKDGSVSQADLMRFWYATHADQIGGDRFWKIAVLREALPRPIDIDAGLQFAALAEPLR